MTGLNGKILKTGKRFFGIMDLKLVCAHNADSEQLVLPSQHNLEVTTSNEPDTNTNDNDAMNIVHETGVILAENNCTSLEENKGPDILKLIGEEARQLQASIENIAPDMDILSKQLSNLSNKVRASKLKQDSRVSRLMMELDFLKVYISQSKADIGAMDSFITKLLIDLTGNPRNSGSTETVTAQKRLGKHWELDYKVFHSVRNRSDNKLKSKVKKSKEDVIYSDLTKRVLLRLEHTLK